MVPVSTRLAHARWHAASPAAAVLLLNFAALFLVFAPASAGNLYWADVLSGIHRANLDGSDVQLVSERQAVALAVDPAADAMFWSERSGLMRSNLDGTDIELIRLPRPIPYTNIALDVDAAKIYLSLLIDRGPGGALERLNYDGTGAEFLVSAFRRFDAIAVDPGTDTLCWSDNGQIVRTNLDATDELVVEADAEARGMALDGAGKIYWIEDDRIRRANVDGSNAEDLVTGLVGEGRAIGLNLRAGEMYWLAGELLQRANLDGSDVVDLVTGLRLASSLALGLTPTLLHLPIDIAPGRVFNSGNPLSRGVIPVAILGSEEFDVARVDPETLRFGPAGSTGAAPAHRGGGHFADVNGDGHLDFLSHYRVGETGLAPGDTEACVTGETLNGTPFEGCDAIEVIASPNGRH